MKPSEDTCLVTSNQQHAIHAVSRWLSRAQAALGRMAAFWAARRQRVEDAEALRVLSDRDLWDLGLSRSDIPGIISGKYRRD